MSRRPCVCCGVRTRNRSKADTLTPEQGRDVQAWMESFLSGYHTGHCPHLVLPPPPVCRKCIPVFEVMSS